MNERASLTNSAKLEQPPSVDRGYSLKADKLIEKDQEPRQ